MKLSASNIAWTKEYDEEIYAELKALGFAGIEIAPTRWFPENPYDKNSEAAAYAEEIKEKYGLCVSSIQSIWYGRPEKIAASPEDRKNLLEYTKKALSFADAIDCPNLVFGCPKSRAYETEEQRKIITGFLSDAAHLAETYKAVIALEPNPAIYNTNYCNTTKETIAVIREINSPSLMLNLDLGAVIENKESLDFIRDNMDLVHHVHISEPMLKPVTERKEHLALLEILKEKEYDGFVSLETGDCGDIDKTKEMLEYLRRCFQ